MSIATQRNASCAHWTYCRFSFAHPHCNAFLPHFTSIFYPLSGIILINPVRPGPIWSDPSLARPIPPNPNPLRCAPSQPNLTPSHQPLSHRYEIP